MTVCNLVQVPANRFVQSPVEKYQKYGGATHAQFGIFLQPCRRHLQLRLLRTNLFVGFWDTATRFLETCRDAQPACPNKMIRAIPQKLRQLSGTYQIKDRVKRNRLSGKVPSGNPQRNRYTLPLQDKVYRHTVSAHRVTACDSAHNHRLKQLTERQC